MGDLSVEHLPTPAFDVNNRRIRGETKNLNRKVGDRWILQSKIGMGAKGVVWKALDADDSLAAVKEISLKKLDAKSRADAMREAEILLELSHSNIVKVTGWTKSDDFLYIAFEFMSEGSLGKTLRSHGSIPEELVAKYVEQVLKGLEYLHERNLVHRDIKGDNILISEDGRVCLADFGLAVKLSLDGSPIEAQSEEVVGTPYWLAPEVILMMAQTTASDIWSVGCTVIELLTGNPPYSVLPPMAAIFRMVQDDMPPLPEGVSEELTSFLKECFIKDVSVRATATQLLEHRWFTKYRQTTTPQKPQEMYKTIKHYNKSRPTVHVPLDLRRHTIVLEEPPIDFDVEVDFDSDPPSPSLNRSLNEYDVKTNNVKDVIRRETKEVDSLQEKYKTVVQRIHTKQMQQNLALRLSKLYSNHMSGERETYEKQIKMLESSISKDLVVKDGLSKALKKEKFLLFDIGKATVDVPSGSDMMPIHQGELLYIRDRSTTPWIVENHTGEITGKVDPSHIELMVKTIDAKKMFLGTLHDKSSKGRSRSRSKDDSNDESDSFKEKISSFLGLAPSTIHRRITTKKLSATSLIPPDIAPEKQKLFCLIKANPHLDSSEYVRDGAFTITVNKKMKERHVFLFTDALIISKQKGSKEDELKIDRKIPLSESRLIMDADIGEVFMVQYKGDVFTFLATINDDSTLPSQACHNWFRSIKQLTNNLHKKNRGTLK